MADTPSPLLVEKEILFSTEIASPMSKQMNWNEYYYTC